MTEKEYSISPAGEEFQIPNEQENNEEFKKLVKIVTRQRQLGRESGVFAEGSMAPKIRAALSFIKQGGKKSIITEATKLVDKKYGSKITMEYDT